MTTLRAPRSARSARGASPAADLVLSVCHEVGNLLAATRLTAYLLRREAADSEIPSASHTLEGLSAHAGSLLALVRPLVDPRSLRRIRIGVGELLDAVAHGIADRGSGPAVDFSTAREMPDIEADPDALHHTLLVLVLSACDAAGAKGQVRVAAAPAGARIAITVRDDGRPLLPAAKQRTRRGRDLALELAAAVLALDGGVLDAKPLRRGSEVRIVLRAAPARVRPRAQSKASSRPAARKPAVLAGRRRARSPRGRAARST